jgi:hypothetical protein
MMAHSRQQFQRSIAVATSRLVWADLEEEQLTEFIRCGDAGDKRSDALPYSPEAMEAIAKGGKWTYG